VAALHDKQIDVGLLYLPAGSPTGSSLRVEIVLREELVVALPAGHRLAAETEVELRDLADEPFVLPMRYTGMPGLYGQVTETCHRAGFTPRAVQKDVWLMQTIVGLVAGGTGVALVPDCVRALGREGVVYRPVRGPEGRAPIVEMGVVWRNEDEGAVLGSFLQATRAAG
jgi:DNA-binding transcriptional LysR family regulator